MQLLLRIQGVVLLALAGGSSLTGDAPTPNEPQPVLRIDEASFDWGERVKGEPIRHLFELHNDGSASLQIESVNVSCGCTAADHPESIEPGASGVVALELKTENLSARRIHKTATVISNDPDRPVLQLVLSGALLPVVEHAPRNVVLSGRREEPKRATVTLWPTDGHRLGEVTVVSTTGRVSVAEVRTVGSDGCREIELEALPSPSALITRDVLRVSVVAEDGVLRNTQIPVRIEHRARVHPDLSALVFPPPSTPPTESAVDVRATRVVTLTAEGADISFSVIGVETVNVPEGLFRASAELHVRGRSHRVAIQRLRNHDVPLVRGKLVITTDDPEVPRLELPILAQFSPAPRPSLR